jgi:hypothetical protein
MLLHVALCCIEIVMNSCVISEGLVGIEKAELNTYLLSFFLTRRSFWCILFKKCKYKRTVMSKYTKHPAE